ncbi:MAG TPA: hypothetical protein VFP14_09805 [Novosphingobium sp.]|nr:hypothetical protein [Novosphingobium sp.]
MNRRGLGHFLLTPGAIVLAAGALGTTPSLAAEKPPIAALSAGHTNASSSFASASLTYADLVDLADRAPSVVQAQIRKVAAVDPARSPGVRPGWVRMYVEARPMALLAGPPLAAESLRYLVDVPLDARGKPPKLPRLAKRGVILFARTVPDRPGELQLVAPDAQVLWDEAVDARVKAILTELLAPGAPKRITGVHEALYVPGNLAGEGETQMFLATADGEPASITVVHQPGKAARWSVSFSEVVDASGEPPARETLAWYRLACFLPRQLPPEAASSATDADRAQAGMDYRLVRESLGECPRSRS